MRYDDTNPEKEEEKYFTAIKEMVEWLGEVNCVDLHVLDLIMDKSMKAVSHQFHCITQATHLMRSRMHQTTFRNSMTLLWILFAGECRKLTCLRMCIKMEDDGRFFVFLQGSCLRVPPET